MNWTVEPRGSNSACRNLCTFCLTLVRPVPHSRAAVRRQDTALLDFLLCICSIKLRCIRLGSHRAKCVQHTVLFLKNKTVCRLLSLWDEMFAICQIKGYCLSSMWRAVLQSGECIRCNHLCLRHYCEIPLLLLNELSA